jgi:hypothetical protein
MNIVLTLLPVALVVTQYLVAAPRNNSQSPCDA